MIFIKQSSLIYPRVVFSVLFVAVLLLAFYIALPFIPTIIVGAMLAYLSYPLFERVVEKVKNKNVSALLVSVAILLLITAPVILVFTFVSKEAYSTYQTISKHNLGSNLMELACGNPDSFMCRNLNFAVALLPEKNLDFYLQSSIKKITEFIISKGSDFIQSIPNILLNLFVMSFVIYYVLKDGHHVARKIRNLIPLRESHKRKVADRFHGITHAVFYVNILTALLQGFLGGLGFFLLGIEAPMLWGFVMAVFALIPYIGTAIVWLPAAMNLLLSGLIEDQTSMVVRGIILLVYGVVIISMVDNIMKPKLIGAKAEIHPIFVLVGVLGGLNVFGFSGVVLGPVILALLMTLIEIYEQEKTEAVNIF